MSQNQEKIPLLNTPGQGIPPGLFPPPNIGNPHSNFHNQYQSAPPPSYFRIVEVVPGNRLGHVETTENTTRRRSGGCSTTALIVIVATAAALLLIMYYAKISRPIIRVHDSRHNNGSGSPLKAGAPSSFEDIEIPQGRLRGYKLQSREGRDYLAFYKVPYATPPLGSLRFRDPTPPVSWKGLRDIPVVAPQCMQKEKYPPEGAPPDFAVGEEDCLYANIYTPSISRSQQQSEKLFPVMVYVHGGGVQGNGSRYGAKYFMDEDVVLVTFQYRLGPFGALSTGDDVIPGNFGFKDQVQMLKWVRDNAKHFNGDPDLVTVFGNSMGGMNVAGLVLSPMTKGLLHRAISQSGAGLCSAIAGTLDQEARKSTMEELGKATSCPTGDSQKYLECLQGKEAAEIAVVLNEKATYPITIEDWEGGDDSKKFLPDKPFTLMESGKFNAIPYIIGNVNAEFFGDALVMLQNETSTRLLNERFEDFTDFLAVDLDPAEMGKVKEFYFGNEKIGNSSLRKMGDLVSDRQMVHCAYLSARYHAKEADTFLYWITKPPYTSYIEKTFPDFPAKEMGFVHHADELQYIFLYDGYPEIVKGDPEYYEYSKHLVKLWANFARTGTGSMDGTDWRKINGHGDGDGKSTFWLELGDDAKDASPTTPQERMAFWDQFDVKDLKYDW